MALGDLTDRQAVLDAMHEFDQVGRERFLSHDGFDQAVGYYIEHEGKRYDSKAVAGVAHGYQHGTPLQSGDFSGGTRLLSDDYDCVTGRSRLMPWWVGALGGRAGR